MPRAVWDTGGFEAELHWRGFAAGEIRILLVESRQARIMLGIRWSMLLFSSSPAALMAGRRICFPFTPLDAAAEKWI
jgi:hypothetical protein